MFKKIKKRDGRIVKFNQRKITDAIFKAGQETREFGLDTSKKLSNKVLDRAKEIIRDDTPTVEQIQDIVETVLIESRYIKTAKAYIIYRDQHARIRDLKKTISLDLVDEYINNEDWRVNENSNMTYSLQGLNNHIASVISSHYWLYKIYPKDVRKAHVCGDFHIHDLALIAPYCAGWDLKDLLIRGFGGVPGKIESKPAKHFRAALGQIVNFFYTLQGETAGAEAFSSIDTYLAPFIRYDKLSYREMKQAIQEFLFNINIPTRVGFQSPFTNTTMDLVPPDIIANDHVIIGGKMIKEQYGEFQKEIDLFNKVFAEVMAEGDAKGRVFTFPIPTYNITKDFDWDNPVLEPIWNMTSKYGTPYFANFINSDMKPEDARSMCCHLRIDQRELHKRGGGFFAANPLTGSIGVVTINMPRIGYFSKTKKEFLNRLSEKMDLAKKSLEIKRKILERFTENNLYPFAKYYLNSIKKRFGGYWRNHFSTIGLIGMNEACLNFLGKDITTKEGREFSIRVLDFMREKLMDYQNETDNIYNLEATPGEGATFRLAKTDKEKFTEIICANEEAFKNGAAPYYTNSTQLPVGYTDDIFEALDLQDELQTKYTGGTVFHGFVGEKLPDGESSKILVKKIAENYRLPYFTITPTFSICQQHGYISGEHETCPECGATTEVYSRVVGYIRPVSQWNRGKRSEFKDRKTFKL